jgi:hypothetical protein
MIADVGVALLLSGLGVLWWNAVPASVRGYTVLQIISAVWITAPLFWVITGMR